MSAKHKIAIFASGYGSNFEAIATATLAGVIPAEVALMVCDKAEARVVEVAQRMGVPSFVFSAKEYASKAEYEREMVGIYTTSVQTDTLDEAPMAYKPMDEIMRNNSFISSLERCDDN